MFSEIVEDANIRAGSVADFLFRYPASVKPYRFQDTERNCILAYPQWNRHQGLFALLAIQLLTDVFYYIATRYIIVYFPGQARSPIEEVPEP